MADADPQNGAAAAAAAPGLGGPAERLRSTAKWMVVAAGAVAAAVVAGLNFANIGSLSGSSPGYRLWIAVGGLLLALAGAASALVVTVLLASASTVSVWHLRSDGPASFASVRHLIAQDPAVVVWASAPTSTPDAAAYDRFAGHLVEAHTSYVVNLNAWNRSPDEPPPPAALARSITHYDRMEGISARILETASYLRLQDRFSTAVKQLAVALVAAGLGLVAVIWAGNPPVAATGPRPTVVRATYAVPGGDRDEIRSRLGSLCAASLDALPVLVVDRADERTVVVTYTDGCTPLRLDVDPADLSAS